MGRQKRPVRTSRQGVNSDMFGAPSDLKETQLPTYGEVMRFVNLVKQNLSLEKNGRDLPLSEVLPTVADRVMDIWKKSSIPVIPKKSVITKLVRYCKKCRGVSKSSKRKNSKTVKNFSKEAFDRLFDICTCRCKDLNNCCCKRELKVPAREVAFLEDQRTERKMMIGGLDVKTTTALQAAEQRRKEKIERLSSGASASTSGTAGNGTVLISRQAATDLAELLPSEDDSGESETTGSEFEPEPHVRRPNSSQTRIRLLNTASAAYRTGVSDRNTALIATAALQDAGIVTTESPQCVIDRSKIRREKTKHICEVQKDQDISGQAVRGIFFDGRKDKTLVQEKKGNKFHRRVTEEEHYTIVEEPGSAYLGHVTPSSGSGLDIATAIINYLEGNQADLSTTRVVGCDGTPINTGKNKGSLSYIERRLRRPLQWLICLLHGNELPLRHLFKHLDGDSTGPTTYSGPIGKKLRTCESLPIISYQAIPLDWLEDCNEVQGDLSTDQKYLLKLCAAVSSGVCPPSVRDMKPGPLNQSRWLTTACRILRLYLSTLSPGSSLVSLVLYVVKVYAPMWFTIRRNPSCCDGARHLWKIGQLSSILPDDLKKIVFAVLQTNGYFAHPENVLLAMITDQCPDIRILGWRRIKKARQISKKKSIRAFVVPEIDFEADSYFQMIDWSSITLTEPPLTTTITSEEIEENIKIAAEARMSIKEFPCHTQAVERMVKEVTQASESVCGMEQRDGFIRARLLSRMNMPKFNTKHDYVL